MYPVSRVVDLLDPALNTFTTIDLDEARRRVLSGDPASVRAIDGTLAEGTTSVGYRVQLDHLAPTAIGGKVRAEATLEMIEGRRLTFRVSVSDGHGLVAAGRITRVIVERARFLEKATGA